MIKRLPPFGKQFIPVPTSGVRVALGPTAWDFQKHHSSAVMVLPDDDHPDSYRWPSDGRPALIFERGTYDDERLEALATVLLCAGAPSVVAIREALLSGDPRLFFDAEVANAA